LREGRPRRRSERRSDDWGEPITAVGTYTADTGGRNPVGRTFSRKAVAELLQPRAS